MVTEFSDILLVTPVPRTAPCPKIHGLAIEF
jgi:hypothetical protein